MFIFSVMAACVFQDSSLVTLDSFDPASTSEFYRYVISGGDCFEIVDVKPFEDGIIC